MNPTIIKEWWLASWEVKVIMIAAAIEGTTGGEIAPYIEWIPGTVVENFIVEWWHIIVLVIVFILRKFKTSTALTWFRKDADSPEVVAAAKAAAKPKTELQILREEIAELKAAQSPKA